MNEAILLNKFVYAKVSCKAYITISEHFGSVDMMSTTMYIELPNEHHVVYSCTTSNSLCFDDKVLAFQKFCQFSTLVHR